MFVGAPVRTAAEKHAPEHPESEGYSLVPAKHGKLDRS